MENWNLDVNVYGREVKLFFSGPEARQFKSIVARLQRDFGTKNQSDTVIEALRQIAAKNRAERLVTRRIRAEWRRNINRAFSRGLRTALRAPQ